MTNPTRPLALALLGHGPRDEPRARGRRRVAVASWAHREGYCLLETLETDGSPLQDEILGRAALSLADRTGARTLLLHGRLDPLTVRTLRDAIGARLVWLPAAVEPLTPAAPG